MGSTIRIQVMGAFSVYVDGERVDMALSQSYKSINFIRHLIFANGDSITNEELIEALWKTGRNSENALKTMVSRLRGTLNDIYPGLGECIVSDRGAYHWEKLPNMTIDLYDTERLMNRLMTEIDDERTTRELYEKLLLTYRVNLARLEKRDDRIAVRFRDLHMRYLYCVNAYTELLEVNQEWSKLIEVCRTALEVDDTDPDIHAALMTALVDLGQADEAMEEYRSAMKYSGQKMAGSEEDSFRIAAERIDKVMPPDIDSIRRNLREDDGPKGAFVCDYALFKQIFKLQMRNMSRINTPTYLAVVQLCGNDGEVLPEDRQETVMRDALDILKNNLRRGDAITRVGDKLFAMLLPTVNYTTGNIVMRRLKRRFYQVTQDMSVAFTYRVGPLDKDTVL